LERDHIIDDCCCQVSTVENSNSQYIFPLLNKIAVKKKLLFIKKKAKRYENKKQEKSF